MFVGHGLAAFALVGAVLYWRGRSARVALQLGVLAGLFATLPDLDVLYGPIGLLGGVSGAFDAAEAFWETGNQLHREVTHSLVVGAVAALAFGLAASERREATVGAVALGGLVVGGATVVSGPIAGVVTAAFVLAGLLLGRGASEYGYDVPTVTAVALVGLLSHPFGDVFTGEPPQFLYPFDVTLLAERVTLHSDPTMHLLAAFGLELAVVWLAFLVALRLTGRDLVDHVDPRASAGFGYAAAAVVLPAPTLETSYHFVFSVLAVGLLVLAIRAIWRRDVPRALGTGLAAVTAAWLASVAVYAVAV